MAKRKTKKVTQLTDLEVDEVSLVDSPANLRPFFFMKAKDGSSYEITELEKGKSSILLESDGTSEGTVIKINGSVVEPIDFSFWLYDYGVNDATIDCTYTVASKGVSGGFKSIKNYRLSKSDTSKSGADIADIQDYLDDPTACDSLDGETATELAKKVRVLADYKDVAPKDVRDAINAIVGMVAKTETQKNGDAEMKLSKEQIEALQEMLKEQLKALPDEETEEEVVEEEAEETETVEVDEVDTEEEVEVPAEEEVDEVEETEEEETEEIEEEPAAEEVVEDEIEITPAELADAIATAIQGD